MATEPLNVKTSSGERVFRRGEVFQANSDKAAPLIERGILRPVDDPVEIVQAHNLEAYKKLDQFFVQVVLPKLSRLHQVGKLPNLAQDPLWVWIEAQWNKAAVDLPVPCDMEATKRALL